MTFETIAANIFGTLIAVTYADVTGRKRARNVAVRIDGRGGSYRVDVKTLQGTPWEAIDGGEGFPTVAAARAHVRRWARAVKAQNTLTPSVARAKGAPRSTRSADEAAA